MTKFTKFAVSAVALVAIFAAAKASATVVVPPTLMVGSHGTQVMNVQTVVGATADGSFGPMTKAKVVAWQSAHGLTADGVVGPMTAAAMNGSSSGSGSTGALCPNGMTLASNCTSSGSTSGSTTLSGGAGDATVTNTTTGTTSTVKEAESNIKVLAFKVKADGSDLAITSAKVGLTVNSGSVGNGSDHLDKYMSGVSVWMGSTKVGSADASDFSDASGTPDVYTKTISLSNAVVKQDKTVTFYVAVDGADTIDTDNQDVEWDVSLDTLRFNDATGAILTADVSSVNPMTFGFDAASADDTLSVTASTSNPQATNFIVEENGTSDNYLVQSFKLKSGTDAGDIQINELPIMFTLNDPDNTATSDSPDAIIDSVSLKIGNNTYESDSNTDSVTNGDGTATYTFSFDQGDVVVSGDSTEEVKVYVKFNDQSDNYGSGTTVVSTLTGSDIDAESASNGDAVSVSGSSTSKTHSLSINAPTIEAVGTPTLTSFFHDDSATDVYLAKFTFNVTAGTDDIYFNSNALVNDSSFPTAAVSYTVTGGSTVNSVTLDPEDGSLDDNSTDYLVTAGSTEKFTLSFYMLGNNAANKVTIDGFSYGLNDTDRDLQVTTGLSDLHTSSVYLAS